MTELVVATLLWDANQHSMFFSQMYDESWVEKLHAGFRRNLTRPFRFVCFTDRDRQFSTGIETERLKDRNPSYSSCIEPYRLNQPMILVGLDTIVVDNIDHLAAHCMKPVGSAGWGVIGLPRDPYNKSQACNGVALVPAGRAVIATAHQGENDMEYMRSWPHEFTDDLFPGQVVSYKGDVEPTGLLGEDVRIVYFHGQKKPHELQHLRWVQEHWRT